MRINGERFDPRKVQTIQQPLRRAFPPATQGLPVKPSTGNMTEGMHDQAGATRGDRPWRIHRPGSPTHQAGSDDG